MLRASSSGVGRACVHSRDGPSGGFGACSNARIMNSSKGIKNSNGQTAKTGCLYAEWVGELPVPRSARPSSSIVMRHPAPDAVPLSSPSAWVASSWLVGSGGWYGRVYVHVACRSSPPLPAPFAPLPSASRLPSSVAPSAPSAPLPSSAIFFKKGQRTSTREPSGIRKDCRHMK